MGDKPIFVVSDIHLGAVPTATEQSFRRFLRYAGEAASGLLINGDLFDFWFEYRSVVPRRHFRVLAAIADVIDAGVPVWFVGGNHDAWGGSFLRDEVGMTMVDGPVVMELAGRRTLVVHGDGVGTGDLGYRILRRFIRHPATVGAFRLVHPDLGARIAGGVSTTEHKAAGHDSAKNRADYIRAWALSELAARPEIDLVIAGHAHIPEVTPVGGGRFYANAGDWLHHFTYLELSTDGTPPSLMRWEATETQAG